MKQATLKPATTILALLCAIVMAGCGSSNHTNQTTFNNGSGDQPFKPKTHLLHRSLVSNSYAGALDVVDATLNDLTTYTFAVGSKPTYMQSSPDGTLTFVNNTGSNSISSFNNELEAVKATIVLCPAPETSCASGGTQSFVTSLNNENGFAAVPDYPEGNYNLSGGIVRFNPTDGSQTTAIPFPYISYLAMDPAEEHLLAFTQGDTTHGDDNLYWVDLTANDPVTGLPALSLITLPAGTLSRPVAAFFSADGSTAFILSCGAECGGSGNPSVTAINAITPPAYISANQAPNYTNYLTPIYQGTATVVQQWPNLPGARIGMIDLTANKLYVAGSTTTSTAIDCPFADVSNPTACAAESSGKNNVQDGYFTVIDLNTGTVVSSTRIGNGVKRWIRNINGTIWVASLNCGVESCVSMVVNPTTATPTASVLATANGDATGISLANISGSSSDDVYTIEGGYLYIYDQKGNTVTSQYPTDVKGQASDVLYIN